MMTRKMAALAAVAACGVAAAVAGMGSARAGDAGVRDELRPIQAHSIAIGQVGGVAYYTAEAAGDRVVATLSGSDGSNPLRVVATLAPGQSLSLSVPRGPGEPAAEVAFTRKGDRVFVSGSPKLTD